MAEIYKNMSDDELLMKIYTDRDDLANDHLFNRYRHIILGMILHYFPSLEEAKENTKNVYQNILKELIELHQFDFKFLLRKHTKSFLNQEFTKHNIDIPKHLILENKDWMASLNKKVFNQEMEVQFNHCYQLLSEEEQDILKWFYVEENRLSTIASLKSKSVNEIIAMIRIANRKLRVCLHQKN